MAVFLKHVNLYYTGPNFPTLKTATYLIYFVIANKCKIVFITPKFFQRDDWASKLNSRLSFCYWVPVAKKNLKLYLPPEKNKTVWHIFLHISLLFHLQLFLNWRFCLSNSDGVSIKRFTWRIYVSLNLHFMYLCSLVSLTNKKTIIRQLKKCIYTTKQLVIRFKLVHLGFQ